MLVTLLCFQSYQGSILIIEYINRCGYKYNLSILSRFDSNELKLLHVMLLFIFQSYQGSILMRQPDGIRKPILLSILSRFDSNLPLLLTYHILHFISILSRFDSNQLLQNGYLYVTAFQSYQGSILTRYGNIVISNIKIDSIYLKFDQA